MPCVRHDARPGLREVWALWGLYGLVAAAVFATYARLPVQELYHVSGNGRTAGAGRALVFLNFPTALAAIAIVAVVAAQARSRTISRLSILAAALCAAVAWPGVVDQVDLDAKWANAIAAAGVVLAVALTVVAFRRDGLGPRTHARGDAVRIVATVALVLVSLPWIAADLGFLIGRWPVLGSVFYSDEWHAPFGHARLHRAVHEGHHHGMDGMLLAVTAILLSRTLGLTGPRLRRALGAYLGLMLAYGLMNLAQDFWLEQLVKRGVTRVEIPSVLVPSASFAWLVLLGLGALANVLLFRRVQPGRAIAERPLVWPVAVQLAVAALLVVGLLHGAERYETRLGSADGLFIAYAPKGTSHIFVARGGDLLQRTDSKGSELAPDFSRDGRIVFQSNRDGDWELYTASPETYDAAVTNSDSDEGEPRWTPDGKEIAFVRDGDIYLISASGNAERKVAADGYWPAPSEDLLVYETGSHPSRGIIGFGRAGHLASDAHGDSRYPAWSPSGDVFAYECRLADRWHICVADPRSGTGRVLTKGDANDFAPAWSPDGNLIAFISDRDGNDQLFVMRADGTGILRITSGQADKDTPAWRP
jgi:Tol biopolymer transport system component